MILDNLEKRSSRGFSELRNSVSLYLLALSWQQKKQLIMQSEDCGRLVRRVFCGLFKVKLTAFLRDPHDAHSV